MVAQFTREQAAVQVCAAELVPTLDGLLTSARRREETGRRARALVLQHQGAAERTFQAVRSLLPGTAKPEWPSSSGRLKRAAKTLAQTMPGQKLLSLRARRLTDLDALRHRLGHPQTILCLGNGPSSEDPELAKLAYDCLFRVNWRWLERGYLTRPAVVFTGDRRSLRRCPPCLFFFQTIAEETSILLNTFWRPAVRQFEYLTAERLPLSLNQWRWAARPTNGAVMVACAVALQPRRLIIAGIDLFQHPAGCYPGETSSPNRYAAVHERTVELDILRRVLSEYRGELMLRGPVLARALGEEGVKKAMTPRAA
jgi:hypothetical protein